MKKRIKFTGDELTQFIKEGKITCAAIGRKLKVPDIKVWEYIYSNGELHHIWNKRFSIFGISDGEN